METLSAVATLLEIMPPPKQALVVTSNIREVCEAMRPMSRGVEEMVLRMPLYSPKMRGVCSDDSSLAILRSPLRRNRRHGKRLGEDCVIHGI